MILLLTFVVVLQSFLLLYPLIKRKLGQRCRMLVAKDVSSLQRSVLDAASRRLSSRRVWMSFNDDESLYAMLAGWKNVVLGRRRHHAYAYFNFPIAFLLLGLLDHHTATGNKQALRNVVHKCEDLLSDAGDLKFQIDKIDQATLGLVFLRLYELTNEPRYLAGSHRINEGIQGFKGDDGLYRYRLGLEIFFIDTIGLLCPFLVRYAQVTGAVSALEDAERQVRFALSHCIESKQGLAVHAFDLIRQQPLGSVNWARGMGWLLLGLSEVVRAGRDQALRDAMREYADVLEGMQEPGGYWPQFLGHTNDKTIDSSGTLMFLYAFQQSGVHSIDAAEAVALAALCVDHRGRVVHASGDTIYINKYSRAKGASELSQGLMLSLLSGLKP
ncbi:glycoside hydrolase family 88 protein [Luteimonas arsenica]|uniref:glycoside hydrolase family 88 protein n=1 Tax=Luteimonas arsenica TaxID=1586242 RepID=UPI00105645CA|nr:glycoside hydrolase family 88 protein [Luteimonas arsenica]